MQELGIEGSKFSGIEARGRRRDLRQREQFNELSHCVVGLDRIRGSDEGGVACHRHRLEAFFAQALDRQSAKTFRQSLAIGRNQKTVVANLRWGCPKSS